MALHNWVQSNLGHGETMCSKCFITNREAAVLGEENDCPKEDGVSEVSSEPNIKAVCNSLARVAVTQANRASGMEVAALLQALTLHRALNLIEDVYAEVKKEEEERRRAAGLRS